MRRKFRLVVENDWFRITRRSSGGRSDPPKIRIEMLGLVGRHAHLWTRRNLDLTIDELFELTEALDDLCDAIEDEEADENE